MCTLSFVVCAYKESPYLRECLQSLAAQTVPCSVSVSSSTPSRFLSETAAEFSVPLMLTGHKASIASDWNSAYQAAKTDYVVLAHQDDIYEPEYAETALRMLENSQHPLLFFSDYYEIRNGQKTASGKNLLIKRRLLRPLAKAGAGRSRRIRRRVLSLGNPICCPAVTYAKAFLPEVPFHEGLRSNLDWDAWERFSRLDGEFLYCPRRLVGHRVHDASTTSAVISSNSRSGEDLEILKRFWPTPVASVINRVYKTAETGNRL